MSEKRDEPLAGDGFAATDQGAETPDFAGMKRDELNAYAAEHGVADPESFGTKAELIEHIEGGGADAGTAPAPPATEDGDTAGTPAQDRPKYPAAE
jgi:TATA-binding protein-associated factor Taf7